MTIYYIQRQLNYELMIMHSERDLVSFISTPYSNICLEGLRKIMKTTD